MTRLVHQEFKWVYQGWVIDVSPDYVDSWENTEGPQRVVNSFSILVRQLEEVHKREVA